MESPFSFALSSDWRTVQPNTPLFGEVGNSDGMSAKHSTSVASGTNKFPSVATESTSNSSVNSGSAQSFVPLVSGSIPTELMESVPTMNQLHANPASRHSPEPQNQTYRPDMSKELHDPKVVVPVLPIPSDDDCSKASFVIAAKKDYPESEAEAHITELEFKLSSFERANDGGLAHEATLPAFMTLMKKEDHIESRSRLIHVLTSSEERILQSFVEHKGLDICDHWLKENQVELGMMVIDLLQQLPVNMHALKENGKIGKTVKKLSGHPEKRLKRVASALLQEWKKLVERDAISEAGARKRTLDNRAEPLVKRPKLAASKAFKTKETEEREFFVVKKKKPKPPSPPKPSETPTTLPRAASVVKKEAPVRAPVHSPTLGLRSSQEALSSSQGSVQSLRSSTSSGASDFPAEKKAAVPGQLVSCLPDPQKRKPKRSISWADQTPGASRSLVQVKTFPRDKTLGVNKAYARRMQQANLEAQKNASANPSAVPVLTPTMPWTAPRALPAAQMFVKGKNSTEIEEQKKRERSQPQVFYPDIRHIPPSPLVVNERNPPNAHASVAAIPLHPAPPPGSSHSTSSHTGAAYGQDPSRMTLDAMAHNSLPPRANSQPQPQMDFQTLKSLLSVPGVFSSNAQNQQNRYYPPAQQQQQPHAPHYSVPQPYQHAPTYPQGHHQGNNYYPRKY